MKNRFLTILLSAFILALASCEKQENKIFVEGATPPVLSASVKDTIQLDFLTADQPAVKMSWTNPDYRFTTGPSSQNIAYQLEIDKAGANFANPSKKVITLSNDLSLTITQAELNDYLLNQLRLETGRNHNIEMRVRSSIGSNALPLFSNAMKFVVKPYAIPPKVEPPASGKLFIVGNATPGGWGNPVPANQEFKKISSTMFEITLPLTGGASYLFLPVNGSWDVKYGGMGANNTNNPDEDDFKRGGGDMKAPSAGGNYKITVDFQRGKFTLTKL